MHTGLFSSDISSIFTLLFPRLLRFLLHSPSKASCARIGFGRLGGRGNMIHFRHGQLAHGVFRIFGVATREVDVLNVTHVEREGRRIGKGDCVWAAGRATGLELWGCLCENTGAI